MGDPAFEVLTSALEVLVLVVARAGRAEQDDVARAGESGGVGDGALERARRRRTRASPSAAASSAAASPTRWIERTFAPIASASGAKLSPLGEPPRIRCTGSSAYAASARRAAATFVAFESLT